MGKTQNNSMVNVICFGSPAKQTFSYGLLLDVGGVVKGGRFLKKEDLPQGIMLHQQMSDRAF